MKPALPAVVARPSSIPVHIVVVGAGLSGMAAARMLRDAGFRVTILEGRNRTGGRVYTSRTHETRIDLGAAWLHGLDGNPLAEFAQASMGSALKMYKNNEQAILLYDREGRPIDTSVVFETYMKFTQMLEALQADFNPEHKEDDESVADNFEAWKRTQPKIQLSLQEALDKLYKAHPELHYQTPQEKIVMNFMFSQLESLQGATMAALNGRDYGHGIEYDGGDHIVASGFQNISMLLSKGLEDIQLGVKVDKIEWDASPASSSSSSKDSKPSVSTLPRCRVHVEKNAQPPLECNGVLITSSIGVLQSGMLSFSPALPRWKVESIGNLGSGLFNKVVLRFDSVFWPSSADYFGFNFPESEPSAQDLSLEHVHAERSNSWFVNYAPVSGVPILIAMLTGSLAERMEKLPDAQVVKEMMRRLRIMFGPSCPAAPTDSLVTRWGSDPFSRGSYSFLKKGGSILDFENVGKPVENCLFWAGEHTSLDRFGYADGAYVSGQREAKRIIDLYSHLAPATLKSKL